MTDPTSTAAGLSAVCTAAASSAGDSPFCPGSTRCCFCNTSSQAFSAALSCAAAVACDADVWVSGPSIRLAAQHEAGPLPAAVLTVGRQGAEPQLQGAGEGAAADWEDTCVPFFVSECGWKGSRPAMWCGAAARTPASGRRPPPARGMRRLVCCRQWGVVGADDVWERGAAKSRGRLLAGPKCTIGTGEQRHKACCAAAAVLAEATECVRCEEGSRGRGQKSLRPQDRTNC